MYINVHIDECDVLDELSDEVINKEYKRRNADPACPGKSEVAQSFADAAF